MPFDLVVDEVKNDGTLLYIAAHLSAQNQSLLLNDAFLRLKGLQGLDVKVVREIPMSSTVIEVDRAKIETQGPVSALAPRQQLKFVVTIPSKNISDYQLELYWKDTPKPADLVVENVQVENDACGSDYCPVSYIVDAVLVLAPDNPFSKVTVASAVVEKVPGVDLAGLIPEDEEVIEVPAEAADEERRVDLRIKVIKTIPQHSAAHFIPLLRVVY